MLVVKRLSSVTSANRVVASGWIEVSLVVSTVRERGSAPVSFILLCITIDCTGFDLFFLCSSLLSTPSRTLSLYSPLSIPSLSVPV